jgi:tetratricopeptide (TPR) repeat protein
MPAAATEVPHVAFTHHRIGIHSAAPPPPQSRHSDLAAGQLIPIDTPDLPAVEQVRLLGLVHFAQLKASGVGPGGNHHHRQAQQLLNDALQRGAGDARVRTALAELAWRDRDASTAAMLSESVIAEHDRGTREWVDAVSILAEAAFAREDFARARGLYEQLAQLRYDARYWFFLGLCEQNCGHTGAAIHALEKSLEIDPVQTGAHQILAALHQRLGNQESESAHRRTLSSIERFLAELESPGREGDGPLRKETGDAPSGP